MNSFLSFFEEMPLWMRLLWVVGVLAVFWILEGNYTLVQLHYKKWRHAGVNFMFLLFTMAINVGFGVLTLGVFYWVETSPFGLLHLVDLPIWLELILALLALDFIAQYGVHYLLHKVQWMWRLHLIHHSDTKVDVTTGTRHHPFDFILRETFALFVILLMGMPIAFYLLYRILSVFFTYFTHANIQLGKIDKYISYVFVSPNMHKFHHHRQMPWTDTNYGNMFSFWDRIFGTFLYEDTSKIRYGLDILDDSTDENLLYQLKIPFDKAVKTIGRD
ncbi:MAG: sterol desaturase [Flavobacteriaceae bacterium CG_4_8_14_3_um_filter_34_10]|nr:sterol desaturase family protein [Flavobacteriia bacterium]OIP50625.1 MAG: sterol desaturase [Flavobacteriaceae bacterium CG2_30_34_30]PIQ17376.1 MAG: sterol desaturase [Flavobacteriaceae bacterium CG18_big_fil_WC_8_21_14_2_50_34_36]PIX08099.1 MAG: sterol desaturase [Flavobacteriaceae bacterium CG_4_8_14_3_um_filter_34_10]PIZ07814.1 MAG: sterol desaturase [Flavobacteriaceae bacterium CG_4_10_14_0_8_um_filter_34_31]PJC07503.1 MAG: sterol desaturase [Flavobacteriaceae bacterium CG_4_9_14_0_8_